MQQRTLDLMRTIRDASAELMKGHDETQVQSSEEMSYARASPSSVLWYILLVASVVGNAFLVGELYHRRGASTAVLTEIRESRIAARK